VPNNLGGPGRQNRSPLDRLPGMTCLCCIAGWTVPRTGRLAQRTA